MTSLEDKNYISYKNIAILKSLVWRDDHCVGAVDNGRDLVLSLLRMSDPIAAKLGDDVLSQQPMRDSQYFKVFVLSSSPSVVT